MRTALTDRFDPGDLIAMFPPSSRGERHVPRARWYWIFGILAVSALLIINAAQGTMGSSGEFQLGDDLRRIFGFQGVPDSEPSFPLVRDIASWVLLAIIACSLVLLRYEWNWMARCLPALIRNGVITPRPVERKADGQLDIEKMYGGKHVLLPDWLFNAPGKSWDDPDIQADSLTIFLGAVRSRSNQIRVVVSLVVYLTALALAFFFTQPNTALFAKIAPLSLTSEGRREWLSRTYDSWWASAQHPWGKLLYFVVAVVAFAVVLGFVIGGLYSIYVARALGYACDWRANWTEVDDDFGWEPLGVVYRTVWQALLLCSMATAVILAVVGFNISSPIGFLIGVSLVSIPLFILAPGLIFRGVAVEAKRVEIEPIREALRIFDRAIEPTRKVLRVLGQETEELRGEHYPISNGLQTAQPAAGAGGTARSGEPLTLAVREAEYQAHRRVLLSQIDRINAAKIRPLRVIPKTFVVVLIPQLIVVTGLVFGAIDAFK